MKCAEKIMLASRRAVCVCLHNLQGKDRISTVWEVTAGVPPSLLFQQLWILFTLLSIMLQ